MKKYHHHIFKSGLAIILYVLCCMQPTLVDGLINRNNVNRTQSLPPENDYLVFYQGVQGKPGVDFPVLSHIPRTDFTCKGLESGYYADLDTDCQVFHICEEHKKISFLCPNGTIFQQSELICEWWFKVNCSDSPRLYETSAEQLREDNARRKASRRVNNHNDYRAIMRIEQQSSVSATQNGRVINSSPPASTNNFNNQNRRMFSNQYNSDDKNNGRGSINYHGSVDVKDTNTNQRRLFRGQDNVSDQGRHSMVSSTAAPRRGVTFNSQSTVVYRNNNNIDSDEESQIPQETASFYNRNSFMNSIQSNHKYKPSTITTNRYPNHKESYTDIVTEPVKYFHRKTSLSGGISSVTPQYLTTQPINNGRPFFGSQVGSTSTRRTTSKLSENLFNVGRTDKTLLTTSPPLIVNQNYETTTIQPLSNIVDLFNVGNVDKSKLNPLLPTATTTTLPPSFTTNRFTNNNGLVVPAIGSFNTGRVDVTTTTVAPPKTTTSRRKIDHATVYGKFVKSPSRTTTITTFRRFNNDNVLIKSSSSNNNNNNKNPIKLLSRGNSYSTSLSSVATAAPPLPVTTGFYVTSGQHNVNSVATSTTIPPTTITTTTTKGFVVQPRPFELSQLSPSLSVPTTNAPPIVTTYPNYQISSADPFKKEPLTVVPTLPTTIGDNFYDSMITTLVNMAGDANNLSRLIGDDDKNDEDGDAPSSRRPGLVVPPSAGPQTLHTLAVYFANALDGLAAAADNNDNEDSTTTMSPSSASAAVIDTLEKQRVTELLTRMTMARYKELFNNEVEITTTSISDQQDDLLEGQHTKNRINADDNDDSPRVRQLAKVFTQALSSYLDDPATFKRVLEEIRPTEPPLLSGSDDTVTTTAVIDNDNNGDDVDETSSGRNVDVDELLSYSDTDTKSISGSGSSSTSLPPARPTWGYILALDNNDKLQQSLSKGSNLDVKNSLSPSGADQLSENFQLADTQSFVSQYNNLKSDDKEQQQETVVDGINNNHHWTTSSAGVVGTLWASTFSVNPASINENFHTTEPISSVTSHTNYYDNDDDDDSTTVTTTASSSGHIIQQAPRQPHNEIKYELRTLPQLTLNSTQVHGLLIDFMNTTNTKKSTLLVDDHFDDQRLHRILRKLNTTETEFLSKMKEIESNPLTRHLILLLISECATTTSTDTNTNSNDDDSSKSIDLQKDVIRTDAVPLHSLLLSHDNDDDVNEKYGGRREILQPPPLPASTPEGILLNRGKPFERKSLSDDSPLNGDDQDSRALQLLNSLYSIASKFGKK